LQSALLRYILEQQNSFLKGYTIRVETVGCVKQIAEVIISPLEDDKMLIVLDVLFECGRGSHYIAHGYWARKLHTIHTIGTQVQCMLRNNSN